MHAAEKSQQGWRERLRGPNYVELMAVVFVAFAALAWALWYRADRWPTAESFLSSWMPNIGTDFAIIAITIVGIERIQEKAKRDRNQPLIDWFHEGIQVGLRGFAETAVEDYRLTHKSTSAPVLESIADLIAFWAEGLNTENIEREGLSALMEAATTLGNALDESTALLIDDPHLTVAIKRYMAALGPALAQARLRKYREAEEGIKKALRKLADAAVALAKAHQKYVSPDNLLPRDKAPRRVPKEVTNAKYKVVDLRKLL
jgi:hypothetical protein